jgi:hypothetical protein
MNKNMDYIKKEKSIQKVIRTEILFAPLLIILPIIVGIVFIYEWYHRGFLLGDPSFNVELMLGLIIIFGNILFDVPFIKSLIKLSRKKE